MASSVGEPLISVVIPTHNRAELLGASLGSLVRQSVPPHLYEVVVVDDGSTDTTAEQCSRFESRLRFKYTRIEASGISAAKNLGSRLSESPLLLFFDDDDIAHEDLVRQHILTHQKNPSEKIAVLGYTTWAKDLANNLLMDYVTGPGALLFCYWRVNNGDVLDYRYFWGGRSSCKRSFFLKESGFNEGFRFGSEDIELGFRLSKLGLRVVFSRRAFQFMNRSLTYDDFCRRCELQGQSQWHFSLLHDEIEVQQWCGVIDARATWELAKNTLHDKVQRVRALEALVSAASSEEEDEEQYKELRQLYGWTFRAFTAKGTVEAAAEMPKRS